MYYLENFCRSALQPNEPLGECYWRKLSKIEKIHFYCIGKIDITFDISVFLTIFPYTTRLGYLGQCMFAKQNAHVCVESFAFVNARLSYSDYLFSITCDEKFEKQYICQSINLVFLNVSHLFFLFCSHHHS